MSGFFSLNLMFLRFLLIVTLLLEQEPNCIRLFIHSSADGHLDSSSGAFICCGARGDGIMNNIIPMSLNEGMFSFLWVDTGVDPGTAESHD